MSETSEDNRYPYPDDMPTMAQKADCVAHLRDLARSLESLAARMEADDYDSEAVALTGVMLAVCAPITPAATREEGSYFTNMGDSSLNDRDTDGDRELGGMSACVGYSFPQVIAVKNALHSRPDLARDIFGPFAQFMGL